MDFRRSVIGILQQLACFCLPFHLLPLNQSITSAGRVFEFGTIENAHGSPGGLAGNLSSRGIEDGFDNVVIVSV